MLLRGSRRRLGGKGQALVEFAIALPLLLLIFCGIADFGRIYYQSLVVNEAAREGGRLAALGKTQAEVQQAVRTYDPALTVVISPAAPTRGANVSVTVQGSVSIITPLIERIVTPNPYPLQATVVLQVE